MQWKPHYCANFGDSLAIADANTPRRCDNLTVVSDKKILFHFPLRNPTAPVSVIWLLGCSFNLETLFRQNFVHNRDVRMNE